MRVLGAIAISLSGAVASFIGVLAALDAPEPAHRAAPEVGRIAAFASPSLATAVAAATPASRRNATAIAASGGAWVPPIVRKRPVDPTEPAPPATVAAAETMPKPQLTAAPKLVAAPRIARAKRAPNPDFDTATRSTLGGPRPAGEAR